MIRDVKVNDDRKKEKERKWEIKENRKKEKKTFKEKMKTE